MKFVWWKTFQAFATSYFIYFEMYKLRYVADQRVTSGKKTKGKLWILFIFFNHEELCRWQLSTRMSILKSRKIILSFAICFYHHHHTIHFIRWEKVCKRIFFSVFPPWISSSPLIPNNFSLNKKLFLPSTSYKYLKGISRRMSDNASVPVPAPSATG